MVVAKRATSIFTAKRRPTHMHNLLEQTHFDTRDPTLEPSIHLISWAYLEDAFDR